MTNALLGQYGLSQELVDEIRAFEARRSRVFRLLMLASCLGIALALAAGFLSGFAGRFSSPGPLAGLLFAAGGTALLALPVALVNTAIAWLAAPRHPKAADLDRYLAARADSNVCDVCVLVKGDYGPKPGVAFCGPCAAWICDDCRGRYDLRALAAARRLGA